MGGIRSILFKGKNEEKVVNKLKICCCDLLLIINDDTIKINKEVIVIKKIKMHIEFIDGTQKGFPEDLTIKVKQDEFSKKFTSEGKNSYSHKADGYYISLNKLGKVFKDSDGWRFQEKLFIPHTSIKMVREQIEYQIGDRDVFILVERYSKPDKPITYAEIKEKLEANGVKFSSESLKAILRRLEKESKIYRPNPNIDTWITTEAKNRADLLIVEEEKQELEELSFTEKFKIK